MNDVRTGLSQKCKEGKALIVILFKISVINVFLIIVHVILWDISVCLQGTHDFTCTLKDGCISINTLPAIVIESFFE